MRDRDVIYFNDLVNLLAITVTVSRNLD